MDTLMEVIALFDRFRVRKDNGKYTPFNAGLGSPGVIFYL